MSFNLKTHHYEKRGGQTVLTRITPYVRVADQVHGAVYLQKGSAFTENGPALKPFPNWLFDTLEKMSSKTRAEVGFTDERIAFLKNGGKDKEPEPEPADLEVIPAPREEMPDVPTRKTITSEEAEAMSFPELRAYANQFDITSNSREALMEKLTEEGHIA